ncbi:MAG TPA: sigma-70 family RNA polymerase sigma factor [Burkholderiaceae bacterium]|nr:sigma-70 family RNA polymerase sigma factor [Burkholderiaceae bacterium]
MNAAAVAPRTLDWDSRFFDEGAASDAPPDPRWPDAPSGDWPGEPDEADAAGRAQPAPELRGEHVDRLPTWASEAQLQTWIRAIVGQDEAALAALYDGTLGRVYGLVHCIVRDSALAEEVVEDTYFQVWRQAGRFDPARGKAITWLLGMARSRALDAIRREARFRHESLDDEGAVEVPDAGPACEDLLDAARYHAELRRAFALLGAQPRQLVSLAFLRGLSHDEIAAHMRLPLGTVKSQIRRALIVLREALGDGFRATVA